MAHGEVRLRTERCIMRGRTVSEPAAEPPELDARDALRGVVNQLTIHGERMSVIIPGSVIEALHLLAELFRHAEGASYMHKLLPRAMAATPCPRVSHLLGWTRDLMAAEEPELVPATSYDGGALIAVDSNGQEAKLSLRNYHVDVHVEDGFARTTIDQTYFNHHPWRLEGTFYFPLPPDASLSRLAMYVDGELNEGGMVINRPAGGLTGKVI